MFGFNTALFELGSQLPNLQVLEGGELAVWPDDPVVAFRESTYQGDEADGREPQE